MNPPADRRKLTNEQYQDILRRLTEADEMAERIAETVAYLGSSKFMGYDSRDGQPNNYVNTNDVLARLGAR